jgi:hypothetical protein
MMVLTAMLLAGCGGGGGGGSTRPAAATLSWVPASVKLFRFTWVDVEGATEYRLLENPDGSSGYTQVASIAPAVHRADLDVFLPARVNASYILSACNTAGCADSPTVFVAGTLTQSIGYLKASNPGDGDEFASSVALSGDGSTLAVGAYLEDSNATGVGGNQADNSAPNSGAVYVFARRDGVWSQQAYVKASNTSTFNAYFGFSVALSGDGDTLAVGAIGENSSATGIDGDQADNWARDSGAVYVFTRDGGVWSQQAYVKASNTAVGDLFGASVGLSGDGNTLAVGATGEDSSATGIDGNQADNAAGESGAAYVFSRDGGVWSQQAYVKASNTGVGDGFGHRVALSRDGSTLAVSTHREDSNATGIDGNQADNSAGDSGAVYVFARDGGGWNQQAYVKASNTGVDDQFGWSMALSGDGSTLAVGTYLEDSSATGIDGSQADNSASNSGAAYVFERSGGAWRQQAYVKASNTGVGDEFGWSVALSADSATLAVGAPREDSNATGIDGNQADNSATNSGAVYLY